MHPILLSIPSELGQLFRDVFALVVDLLPALIGLIIALEKRYKLFSKMIETVSDRAVEKAAKKNALPSREAEEAANMLMGMAFRGFERQLERLHQRITVMEDEMMLYRAQVREIDRKYDTLLVLVHEHIFRGDGK